MRDAVSRAASMVWEVGAVKGNGNDWRKRMHTERKEKKDRK